LHLLSLAFRRRLRARLNVTLIDECANVLAVEVDDITRLESLSTRAQLTFYEKPHRFILPQQTPRHRRKSGGV